MSLTFAAVHTAARHLAFERLPRDTRGANRPTLGCESYPEALKALTMELFDALPEGRQDDVWASLGRRVDRLNEFLTGREQVASRESTATFESFKGARIAEGGRRESVTDAIRAVPLAHVVEALTGETILRSGVLRCPLPDHDDRVPSFTVYPDHFHCFGCGAHGTAFDLAAAVWRLDARRDFPEVRDRLADALLGVGA